MTRTLDLADGIPPVAGRAGRPRGRPEAVLGDTRHGLAGYSSVSRSDVSRSERSMADGSL